MKVMEKNAYLSGLEEIFKKYGITQVHSRKPATNTYQTNDFYPNIRIGREASDALSEYTYAGDDGEEGFYYAVPCSAGTAHLHLFYDNGTFYTA